MIFGAKINKNPFNHIIKRIFFHINGPSLSEDWLRENAVSLKKIAGLFGLINMFVKRAIFDGMECTGLESRYGDIFMFEKPFAVTPDSIEETFINFDKSLSN